MVRKGLHIACLKLNLKSVHGLTAGQVEILKIDLIGIIHSQ